MSGLFNTVRSYVQESFHNEAQMLHFDRTVYWLQRLKPAADEALLIAAIGHDLERAFRKKHEDYVQTGKHFTNEEQLQHHSEVSAQILADFLSKNNAPSNLIQRVKHLVSRHEVGGDEDQNLLKDADSLSFVENNASIFLARIDKLGYERVKEKFDWMYNRISSPQAKNWALPYYENMLTALQKARISS